MSLKIKLSLTSFPCEDMTGCATQRRMRETVVGIFSETLQAQASCPTMAAEVQVDPVPF